jgi:hypothetical protein
MCEVSLVVALALLQQCNSTTLLRILSYATILADNNGNTFEHNNVNGDVTMDMA